MKKTTIFECETEATETKPETATDPEVGKFVYDVRIHNAYGWDTYTVRADGLESAEYKAVRRMELETDEEEYSSIDVIRIYKEDSNELLKEIIFESAEAEETTDPEVGKFVYDVGIHNFYECHTYTVRADNPESAEYKVLKRLKKGKDDKEYYSIDFIRIHKENSEAKSELNTKYDVLADDQFHRHTKTLIKSLFKAIGTDETRKIPFIISNNMVFFNYNGTQYKYYPSQCKIFKKCDKKYQRINWKDFADDNSPTDQKQALGRSPPFTPDIRSINIDKFKIKE